MAVQTEGNYVGDVVKWETENRYCREEWTVGLEETLKVGTVCKTSGSTKVAIGAGEGGDADSICLQAISTVGSIVAKATFLVRGPANINSDKLDVPSAAKTAALAELADLGIIDRPGVH
jgi:hypothetical protein